MWKEYRRGGWRGWLLPLALVATLAEQIYLLNAYPTWSRWMVPIMVVLSVVAVGGLVGGKFGELSSRIAPRLRVKAPSARFLVPALAAGVLALMIAPTVWAVTPILLSRQADTLVAGPPQTDGFGGAGTRPAPTGGGRDENANADSVLIRYLEANQGATKFLVAVPSSMTADGLILATNKPVMALGGFSGSDPILTTSQLASLVKNGTVRFFLLTSFNLKQLPQQILNQIPQQFRNRLQQGGFGPFGQQSTLTTWVTSHCTVVPTKLWQSTSTSSGTGPGFGRFAANQQLYDCATTH